MSDKAITLFGGSRHHVVRWKEDQVCKCDDKGHFKNNCPKQRAKVLDDSTNLRGISPPNIVENDEHQGICSMDSEDCHPPVRTNPAIGNPMCSDTEEGEIIGSDAAIEVKEAAQDDWTFNSDVYFNSAPIKEFGIEKVTKVVSSPAIRLKSQVAQILGKNTELSAPITFTENAVTKISPYRCATPDTCVEIPVSPVPSSHSEDQSENYQCDNQFQVDIDHSTHESQLERAKRLCVNIESLLNYFEGLEKTVQSAQDQSELSESDSDKTIHVAQSILSPPNKVIYIDRCVVESEEISAWKDDYDDGEILVYGSKCTLDLDAKNKNDEHDETKEVENDEYEKAKDDKEDVHEEPVKQRKLQEEFSQWYRYYRSRGISYFLCSDKDGKLVPMTKPMDNLPAFGEEFSTHHEDLNEKTHEDLDEQPIEDDRDEDESCDFDNFQFSRSAYPAFGVPTNRQFNASYIGAPHLLQWQQGSNHFAQGQFQPQVNPFAYSTGFMPHVMQTMMAMSVPMPLPAFGMSGGFLNYPMQLDPAVPMSQPTPFVQFSESQCAFGKSQCIGNFSSSQHGNECRRMSRSQSRYE